MNKKLQRTPEQEVQVKLSRACGVEPIISYKLVDGVFVPVVILTSRVETAIKRAAELGFDTSKAGPGFYPDGILVLPETVMPRIFLCVVAQEEISPTLFGKTFREYYDLIVRRDIYHGKI